MDNDDFVMDMDKEGGGDLQDADTIEEFLELEDGYQGRKIWLVKVGIQTKLLHIQKEKNPCFLFSLSFESQG